MVDTAGNIFIFLLILFIGGAFLGLTGCAGKNNTADDIPSSVIFER